jgi:DNA-binding response OmpR family regulator
MAPTQPTAKKTIKTTLPALLVVDAAPSLAATVNALATEIRCRVLQASSLRQARAILAKENVELLLTDTRLPDGDGLSLLPVLKKRCASATALITSDSPNVDDLIEALRHGAVDFIPKSAPRQQLSQRLKSALERHRQAIRVERRIDRLTDTVKRLNEAKQLVGKKVDLLCNDLVQAYGELSRQMDSVRIQEDFRKCIEQAKDLEQLLCHAMDWMMRRLGYANIAVWLMAGEGNFELAAYVKYSLSSETSLVEAMKSGLVPQTLRHTCIHLSGAEARNHLTPAELSHLAGQALLSTTCAYLGETLAVVTLFREETSPFTAEDAATLRMIAPLLAAALGSMTHAPQAEEPAADDSDWWKNGSAPPF